MGCRRGLPPEVRTTYGQFDSIGDGRSGVKLRGRCMVHAGPRTG